jgi:hypothetical protein
MIKYYNKISSKPKLIIAESRTNNLGAKVGEKMQQRDLHNCKVLLNKDHATCGKERYIRNPDCRAITLRFRVRRLG